MSVLVNMELEIHNSAMISENFFKKACLNKFSKRVTKDYV